MRPVTIDALEVLTSIGYALILEKSKRHLTSDHTWMQVTVGVGYTLGFIDLRLRQHQAVTPEQATQIIRRSFVMSGAPIIGWQMLHSYNNHRAADQRLLAWLSRRTSPQDTDHANPT